VCTGGRKKKLNASMLATETAIAYPRPKSTATATTASRYSTPRLSTGANERAAKTAPVTSATSARLVASAAACPVTSRRFINAVLIRASIRRIVRGSAAATVRASPREPL